MPKCSECKTSLPTVKSLILHLQICHKFNVSSKYLCGENDCSGKFDNVHNFKSHLRRFHLLSENTLCNEARALDVATDFLLPTDGCEETLNYNDKSLGLELECTPDEFKSALYSQADAFVAKLYANPALPRSHIQHVINDVSSFLSGGFTSLMQDKVLKALRECGSNESTIHDIQTMFGGLTDPFSHLKTEYHRLKHFKSSGDFIPPESFVFGKRLMNRKTKEGLKVKWENVTSQFIPFRHVLQKFLELPYCLSDIVEYIDTLKTDDHFISNFVQGKLWQEKRRKFPEEVIVLPLFLYFDEFETNNPLGPHSEKLGAIYLSIPCLPPECQSSLENIFLIQLFDCHDRQEFGNSKVLRPLVEEFKYLEESGISISTEDGEKLVYFALGLVIGDNLGVHQICGHVGSFSANYPCRFCKASKVLTEKMVAVDHSILRTPETYDHDLALNNVSQTGISSYCVFNDISSFHVTSNYGVDVMHDVAEGVLHYVVIKAINHFLEKKYFTLDVLNLRIQMFDYGPHCTNKPPCISADSLTTSKLKMTSSEATCFLRHIGVLIGDLVPENNNYWRLVLALLNLIDILMAKCVPKSAVNSISVLVEELNSLYLSLGKNHLVPKFHHLVHYAMIFEQSGPINNLSCIRFEAKHRELKRSANVIMSRVNIAHSLAVKHQLNLCNRFLSRERILSEMSIGPVEEMYIHQHEHYPAFKAMLPASARELSLNLIPNWIDFKGTRYCSNMVLIVDVDSEMFWALFGKIKFILIHGGVPIFICQELNTVGLNAHFHAYEVEKTSNWCCVTPDDLIDPLPVYDHVASTGELYVVLRYCI